MYKFPAGDGGKTTGHMEDDGDMPEEGDVDDWDGLDGSGEEYESRFFGEKFEETGLGFLTGKGTISPASETEIVGEKSSDVSTVFGRVLEAETITGSSPPLLGFLGDEESRRKKSTDVSVFTADEGNKGSVEMETLSTNEKGENLTTDSTRSKALQKLGFEEASINGGRMEEPFNLDEFLRLANAVTDKGDDKQLQPSQI
ncbi:UNVERIFIED_CONTAM: hypothetical protein Sindi_0725300 [Sesamum indicum]